MVNVQEKKSLVATEQDKNGLSYAIYCYEGSNKGYFEIENPDGIKKRINFDFEIESEDEEENKKETEKLKSIYLELLKKSIKNGVWR